MRKEADRRWHKKEVRIDPIPLRGDMSVKEHSRIRGRAESLAKIVSNKSSEVRSKISRKVRREARSEINLQSELEPVEVYPNTVHIDIEIGSFDPSETTIASRFNGNDKILRRAVELDEEIDGREQADIDVEWSSNHFDTPVEVQSLESLRIRKGGKMSEEKELFSQPRHEDLND